MIESSRKVAPWRDSVAWAVTAAAREAGWVPLDGPCDVDVAFYLPRPASAPRSRLRPDRKPDLDKLLRSTLDAIVTAGAIADDARIVRIGSEKHYAGPDRVGCGAVITIRPSRKDTQT
jgi:Holliday junction resolvase RusA-like endonuclease